MQLTCPFCRRKPDHKTLSRYNPQALALGGVQEAIADRGWFYAWCLSCGFAKRVFERVCVNGDRLPPVQDFRCEDCEAAHAKKGAAWRPNGMVRTKNCPNCDVTIEKVRVWKFLSPLYGLMDFARSMGATTSRVLAEPISVTSVGRVERCGLRTIAMPICRQGMVDVSMMITMAMAMAMISLISKLYIRTLHKFSM
jgi:hypothetical protein